MRVADLFEDRRPSFSFEFFPPKTEEGIQKLYNTIDHLAELEPTFVSVTYGAGGSTRGRTVEIASHIKSATGIESVAHITCRDKSRVEVESILDSLKDSNVLNVLALRGDPPVGQPDAAEAGEFTYANDLVSMIRERGDFCIGAACYPEGHVESPSLDDDMDRLVTKVEAGTDLLITQLFFDNDHYFRFLDRARARGIEVPIIAGIMPVTNVDQLRRFTSLCGATVPDRLMAKLDRFADDPQAVMAIGIEWAIVQCRELLANGAPGIHFYTLNKSLATRVVCVSLKGLGS